MTTQIKNFLQNAVVALIAVLAWIMWNKKEAAQVAPDFPKSAGAIQVHESDTETRIHVENNTDEVKKLLKMQGFNFDDSIGVWIKKK
jgi:hypothetical protein